MGNIRILSQMTFLESLREKVFIILLIFGFILFGLSIALGNLSFAEQERITTSFGLSAVHLVSIVVAIFLGCSLFYRDFEKKTIHLLLAKPISRAQYLFGRFFGFSLVLGIFVACLSSIVLLHMLAKGLTVTLFLFASLFFIFLEAAVILSIGMFFSLWTRPLVAGFLTISFFLIGHWLESLMFFATKSNSEFFRWLAKLIAKAWPDLSALNLRSKFIAGEVLASMDFLVLAGYSLFLVSAILAATQIVLTRKDLV